MRGLSGCAACLVLALLPGADALTGQTTIPKVTDVRFEGNEAFPDAELQRQIATRPSSCKSWVYQVVLLCPLGFDFAEDARFLNRRRTLPDDVARLQVFYFLRGYREAVVDTVVTASGGAIDPEVEVAFRIQENEPTVVDSMELGWPDGDPLPDLIGELRTREGSPLDGEALALDLDSIRVRLQNAGYAHADVFRSYFIPRGERQAEVRFDIYPGPSTRVGAVTVAGNEKVSDAVIKRLLPFEEGNTYRQRLMEDARRNIFSVDLFRSANVVPDLEHQPDSIVPIRVDVAEGPILRGRWGAGLTTADCVSAEATATHRNFVGGGRRLQLSGRVSNFLAERLNDSPLCQDVGEGTFARRNWLVSADFTQPWFFTPRHTLTASLFWERQSLKDVFVRRAIGAQVAVNRSLGRGTLLSLSYQPQRQRLTAAELFFCSSFLVCEPEDIALLQGSNWLSPGVLSFTASRTDQLLNPTRGWNVLAELEAAGGATGSDFGYSRLVSDGALYTELSPGWVLATRVRAGAVRASAFAGLTGTGADAEIVHPQKRFFAGGANTVRGFSQNQLGPRVLTVDVVRLLRSPGESRPPPCLPEQIQSLTCDAGALDLGGELPRPTGGSAVMVANAELRFPIGVDFLQGAAFMDVGQVWPEGTTVTPSSLEWSPGLGVRWFSPIGPIRVDLGYRLAGTDQLQVITQQVRPFDPLRDDESDRIVVESGQVLDFVPSSELAVLGPRVPFGDVPDVSFRRVQFHLSIGQAF